MLALTLAGALQSVRAVVWFSLALGMLLPVALDGIVPPSDSPPVNRRLGHVLAGTVACLVAGTALFALTRSNAWYEQDMSARGARATARAAAASDTRAAVWASGRYGNWLLWKERSLHGRVAWDARFELLTEAELRTIVRFNRRNRDGGRQPGAIRSSCSTSARAPVRRGRYGATPASTSSSPTTPSWCSNGGLLADRSTPGTASRLFLEPPRSRDLTARTDRGLDLWPVDSLDDSA